MRIAICDDNEIFLKGFANQIRRILCDQKEEIEVFSDYHRCLKRLSSGGKYDVIFLDINYNGQTLNGMEVAEEIALLSPFTRIVYVTGNPKAAQHIFLKKKEANIVGFLEKPVKSEILCEYIQRLDEDLATHADKVVMPLDRSKLVFMKRGFPVLFNTDSILFIESEGHNLNVYTNEGKYVFYQTLKSVLDKIPTKFCFCHKSYIVNLGYVTAMHKQEFVVANHICVPISRNRYGDVSKHYRQFVDELYN